MAKTVSFDWTIQILPAELNTDFKLSIDVDAPQIGSSTVRKPDGSFATGKINQLLIGQGNAIKGKTCNVSTMVTDYSETTDATVVHYELNGHRIDFNEKVSQNHGSVVYNIRILFR